jgi:DNA-binding NtrC family response regulator
VIRKTRRAAEAETVRGVSQWIRIVARYDSSHPDVARVIDTLERLQDHPYKTNALLVGEAGTGKEGLAKALHAAMYGDGRAPFVPVHAVGRDPDALRRELVEGGLLAEADGGTIFLDEIADLSGETQLLLTRALRKGTFPTRRGMQRISVTIVACTERDLEGMVHRSEYRHDFFYRLARLVLRLPPLRERPADVARAAIWIGNRVLQRHGKKGALVAAGEPPEPGDVVLTAGAVDALSAHAWPGNFRELEAVLERALLLHGAGAEVRTEHVKSALDVPHGGERPR